MRRLSLEDFNGLVDGIYRASLDSSAWNAFATTLSARMGGGVWVAVHAHDHRTNANLGFVAAHWDPEFVASYRREYAAINPWAVATLCLKVGEAQTSEALVDPRELKRMRFYNEWVRPQEDIGTGGGITIYRDEKAFVRMSTNIRTRDQEKLQADLMRLLNLLYPHLQRAFVITRHLAGQRLTAELEVVLDSIAGAVVLIDAKGRQHRANRNADRLSSAGVYHLDRAGRVVMYDHQAYAALTCAIDAIARHDHAGFGQSFKVRGLDGRFRSATIAPLSQTEEGVARLFDELHDRRPVAILCIADDGPTGQDLVAVFGLTPAEASLAMSLYEGGTLKSFAEARCIRVDTARKQLGSIFQKTGTAKQSQLVSRIAKTPWRDAEAVSNGALSRRVRSYP
jgi:DNA-binding CsgD family transcriptional regulator/PAS domain-containing protein